MRDLFVIQFRRDQHLCLGSKATAELEPVTFCGIPTGNGWVFHVNGFPHISCEECMRKWQGVPITVPYDVLKNATSPALENAMQNQARDAIAAEACRKFQQACRKLQQAIEGVEADEPHIVSAGGPSRHQPG